MPLDEVTRVRLSTSLLEKMKNIAKKNDYSSASEFIRQAIRDKCERLESIKNNNVNGSNWSC
ncbi:ribbon-helix-helix protein, CopG family [Candidatus Pacearchaeota archaeon]|nr:ribbon-helix-helix protein, CopG family [Candidatus Pacearchaeota archaeon]